MFYNIKYYAKERRHGNKTHNYITRAIKAGSRSHEGEDNYPRWVGKLAKLGKQSRHAG